MIIQSEKFIQNPIVSVVIITYNQEQYIRQCIESILDQETEYPYELIIGEDCGTDATREICIDYQRKYPEKIKLLLQDSNQGLLRNYRDVLYLCRGKYIAQCAGDDYWIDKSKTQKQVEFLEANEEYGFSGTGAYELRTKKFNVISYECKQSGDIFERALINTPTVACTVVFRNQLLDLIDFNEYLKRGFSAEDYPMQVIFAKHSSFFYLNEITSVYRIQEKSISNNKNIKAQLDYQQGLLSIRQYFHELYPETYSIDETPYSNQINYLRFRVAKNKFDYQAAKKISNEFINSEKRTKKTKLITSNKFTFLMYSIISRFANYFIFKHI